MRQSQCRNMQPSSASASRISSGRSWIMVRYCGVPASPTVTIGQSPDAGPFAAAGTLADGYGDGKVVAGGKRRIDVDQFDPPGGGNLLPQGPSRIAAKARRLSPRIKRLRQESGSSPRDRRRCGELG